MRRLLPHHLLFLWLRTHLLLVFPVCHATRRVEVVCGDFSAIETAMEMESNVVGGDFDVRLRHPAMLSDTIDLVEGMKYEVAFTSQYDEMEVQGVALIVTTDSGTPMPLLPSSWPTQYRCDIRPSDPLPPSAASVTSVSTGNTETDLRTFPTSELFPEMEDIKSTPSSVSSSISPSEIPQTQPLLPSSDVSSLNLILSSSSSLFSSSFDFSSSLSSAGSHLSSTSPSVSTPELTSSLPIERFSERLPFSLFWTAEDVASPCLNLTFVILVNSSAWVRSSRELCKPVGCKEYFTSETGVLRSPSYPAHYPDSSQCTYVIYTNTSSPLELQFQMFQLEQPYADQCVDSVSVSDSHSVMDILCGEYDVQKLRQLYYVTSDDTLVLHFVSDNKISSKGFLALYTTSQSKACDMAHKRLNGTIRSPTRPSTRTYLPNMVCNHTIHLPKSYRIRFYLHRLNFSDLETGQCTELDFLHFRDLDSQSEARITCSDDVTGGDLVFESSGSRVEMLFASDHVYQGQGFEVFYVGVPSCRNETYNTSTGYATSVNFPDPYPNMQECFYFVLVDRPQLDEDELGLGDAIIEVTFQEFSTESDASGDTRLRDELCSRDFVEILVDKAKHRVCGDWSGKEHLLYFRFRTTSVVFRFVSDEQETRRGFNASWRAVKEDSNKSCLSTWLESGELRFQVLYHAQSWEDGEVDCVSRGGHLATIPNNNTQQLLNQHLLTQCVPVHVACSKAETYWIGSNDRQWESDFYWLDGSKVSFTNWFPGFRPAEQDGGVTGHQPSEDGQNEWRYGHQPSDDGQADEDCVELRRRFALPDKGQTLTRSFYWNDQSCRQKNPYICQIEPKMVSPPVAQCDRNVTLSSAHPEVRLHSPGYPHSLYPDHTNCTIFLHAPPSAILEVEFWDFQLESPSASGWCEYDYVEISTNPLLGERTGAKNRRCGDWSKKVKLLHQVVTSFYAFLHFHADHSKRFRGFDVTVRMLEGSPECLNGSWIPSRHGCVQVIPKEADSQTDNCSSLSASLWAPETETDLLVFLTHQLATARHNETQQLEIVTILDTNKKTCQIVSASDSDVIDNVPVVTHVTKSRAPCNTSGLSFVCFKPTQNASTQYHHVVDAANRTEGQLRPPLSDDGRNYTNDASATWTLRAAVDQRVLLMLRDVELEEQAECLYDGILMANCTPSRPICGRLEDGVAALSLGHSAEVSFHSDYSVTGRAFTLIWQSLNMTLCRTRTFTETSATFSSFNFPRPFPDDFRCFVFIVVEEGSRVLLEFSHILFNDRSERSIGLDLGGGGERLEGSGELMIGVEDDEEGATLKRVFVSLGNSLRIRMERSGVLAGEGFRATYKMVSEPCTLEFDTAWLQPNSSSNFLSPNFPFSLPDNVSFNYTLRAPIGYYIHVTFSYFRLRDQEACSDVMEIDDVSLAGKDLGPRRLARLCGREGFVNDTVSELNSIRIVYVGGEAAVGDRGKRSVAEDEGPIGFNISFRVYPDPAVLEKTNMLSNASFDSCAEEPCQHNSTCTELGDRAWCTCPVHYTGLFCQVTWCQIPTCAYGDCELIDSEPGFRCHCMASHFGKLCQLTRTQCRKQICYNSGDCIGNSSHLQCTCDDQRPEKTGPFCNVTVDHVLNMTIGQRLLGEPIWIGLIVILSVLLLFGILCVVRRKCAKRYACCQIQFKQKDTGMNPEEGKRGAGSYPLTTLHPLGRKLLRPSSYTSGASTSSVNIRAAPVISITKAEEDSSPTLPTKTTEELKAEVAARFFASYREAERTPVSSALPTDFSKATDTFLAQTSEDTAVGAIVGGTLLSDLHHRKSRDDRLSRSSLSLNPSSRRHSLSPMHRERIRRCNSAGSCSSRHEAACSGPDDSCNHQKASCKARSLDDREDPSLGSDRDVVFSPSPGDFRTLSASPAVQGSGAVDLLAVSADGAREGPTGFSTGEGAQHLFPKVIVHAAPGGGQEDDDTSDCSYRESPTKPSKEDVNVTRKTKTKTADRLVVGAEGRLDRSRSRSVVMLSEAARAGNARLTESRSDSNLRHKDDRRRSSRGAQRSGRSHAEYEERPSRRRRDPREAESADELAADLTALPITRDRQQRLLHQHTVDSYLRPKSKSRRAQESVDYPRKERHAGSFRRSSTSPVSAFMHAEGYEHEERDRQHEPAKRSSADSRRWHSGWDHDGENQQASTEHKHKTRTGHRQQSAKERRGMYKRNETVAAPATAHSHHSRSKRCGHARRIRKCSSVDVPDPELHLPPPRAHSEEMLDACRCQECVSRSGRSRSSGHRLGSDSASSSARRSRTRSGRDKPARERVGRDAYAHSPRSARSSDASVRTLPSTRTPSGSFSSRAEQELRFLKTSSSESERLFLASSETGARASGREGRGTKHRGIEALGSSSSDRDPDLSRRELFMKFFSQEVDLEDTLSPEEPRFFLAPEDDSLEPEARLPQSFPVEQEAGPSDGEPSVFQDGKEQLTVASCSGGLSHGKRPGTLTSKCSVIMYDDDLRTHSRIRSLSVSNNASPNRTPALKEPETPPATSPHSVVINVENVSSPVTAANRHSSSASSEIVQSKTSDPSSLLSVTDTDSAMSSAASRQTSPCFDVLYTSSGSAVTHPQVVPKARDSAYQTKESSVDMFENWRDSRRRKSVPTSRVEDRRVNQRLHQAAIKLFILQQRVRKGHLSRDSAVNTISEDEAGPDGEVDLTSCGYQSRHTWLNRKPLTLPERNGTAGEEEDMEEEAMQEEHGITEEEEQESDLDLRSGLNPTPEILQVPAEIILEEPLDGRKYEA